MGRHRQSHCLSVTEKEAKAKRKERDETQGDIAGTQEARIRTLELPRTSWK